MAENESNGSGQRGSSSQDDQADIDEMIGSFGEGKDDEPVTDKPETSADIASGLSQVGDPLLSVFLGKKSPELAVEPAEPVVPKEPAFVESSNSDSTEAVSGPSEETVKEPEEKPAINFSWTLAEEETTTEPTAAETVKPSTSGDIEWVMPDLYSRDMSAESTSHAPEDVEQPEQPATSATNSEKGKSKEDEIIEDKEIDDPKLYEEYKTEQLEQLNNAIGRLREIDSGRFKHDLSSEERNALNEDNKVIRGRLLDLIIGSRIGLREIKQLSIPWGDSALDEAIKSLISNIQTGELPIVKEFRNYRNINFAQDRDWLEHQKEEMPKYANELLKSFIDMKITDHSWTRERLKASEIPVQEALGKIYDFSGQVVGNSIYEEDPEKIARYQANPIRAFSEKALRESVPFDISDDLLKPHLDKLYSFFLNENLPEILVLGKVDPKSPVMQAFFAICTEQEFKALQAKTISLLKAQAGGNNAGR